MSVPSAAAKRLDEIYLALSASAQGTIYVPSFLDIFFNDRA
jgi:hypothetical protein